MANKTEEITGKLEKVLENVEYAFNGLHGTIKAVNFADGLSGDSLEKLKLHLGYAKTYSELAKTRLIYSRFSNYEDLSQSLRTEVRIQAPRDSSINNAKRKVGKGSK